jgi:hypothetical protein
VRRLNGYLTKKRKFAPHSLIVIHDETYQKVKSNAIILADINRKDVINKNCSDGGTKKSLLSLMATIFLTYLTIQNIITILSITTSITACYLVTTSFFCVMQMKNVYWMIPTQYLFQQK